MLLEARAVPVTVGCVTGVSVPVSRVCTTRERTPRFPRPGISSRRDRAECGRATTTRFTAAQGVRVRTAAGLQTPAALSTCWSECCSSVTCKPVLDAPAAGPLHVSASHGVQIEDLHSRCGPRWLVRDFSAAEPIESIHHNNSNLCFSAPKSLFLSSRHCKVA